MYKSAKELLGYTALYKDGESGKLRDIYFDDVFWRMRYLVIETGKWLPGRKVLINPVEIKEEPHWATKTLSLNLDKKQIEDSPEIRDHMPVSRQKEIELSRYYRWVPYWEPMAVSYDNHMLKEAAEIASSEKEMHGDSRLRSCSEVIGYTLRAEQEDTGRVEDFIVDTNDWYLRYFVVNIGGLIKKKHVLIATEWVTKINWPGKMATVSIPPDKLEAGPEFDYSAPINRAYELKIYDFYGRPAYWKKKDQAVQKEMHL